MEIDKDKIRLTESTELRRIAEERMCKRISDEGLPPSEEAMQRIVHELEVHQIELVMQNEELRQARFEVETALEKYTDLYEFAPVGYFTLDRDGSISAVNLAAASLLRIERSLLIGRRFGQFLSPEYRHTFTAFLERVFSGPGDETCEVVLLNNVSLPLTVQLGATASASGTECRLALIDITGRRQAEDALQKAHDQLEDILKARTSELTQANAQQQELAESNRRLEDVSRTKSDFLANMSHELRTPLNSVIGFSEVLQDRMFGPINEKQQEYVTNILTSGRHLLSLINDILDLSKVESGKMVLELTDFSLRETIADSLTMLKEKARKQGITLTMNLTPQADITIVADQRKLKQILFNLLSNAVKFTPNGGAVGVTAEKDGFLIEIKVADSGMGIRKEDIPKLFQAFTQLESVYTKEYEGTGLGLALTRQLVELHGGRIWVESDFGAGSTFSFTIPIAQSIP